MAASLSRPVSSLALITSCCHPFALRLMMPHGALASLSRPVSSLALITSCCHPFALRLMMPHGALASLSRPVSSLALITSCCHPFALRLMMPHGALASGNRMSGTLLRQMDSGADHSAVALQEAMFERTRIFREIQAWFEDCDIVATPTLSRTALAIDHDFFAPIEIDGIVADTVRKAWYPYTLPFNLSGNPAVTLPCGRGAGGLPIGLQLVGPHLGDAHLLRAAALFEMARPWAGDRPPFPGS